MCPGVAVDPLMLSGKLPRWEAKIDCALQSILGKGGTLANWSCNVKTDKNETYNREVDDPLPPRWVANIVGLFLVLVVILAVIMLFVILSLGR